jgi:lysophospholipase L1-like esterase
MLAIALRGAYPEADVSAINAGISGNTTRDALARIDRDVLRHKPTLVTVMFGLNDMTRVPLGDYRANLDEIVNRCRAVGAEVLLCTPNDVISTADRPVERLRTYCDEVRACGRRLGVPVCDVYADLESQRERDPLAWRLEMSDEIHPNMNGHRRIAEVLARAITGEAASLADVPLPSPALPTVAARLKAGQPIRVLAMPPMDDLFPPALLAEAPGADLEITAWPTAGKTLPELEQDAKTRVRPLAPDLVVLAVPREAKANTQESFISSYTWIMNWSLSFGESRWDCVVVHPSVFAAEPSSTPEDDLIRRLVRAQDLPLIDRRPGDDRTAAEILRAWFHQHPWQSE